MTDTTKYTSVAIRHSTDNQLKDLVSNNETPISKAGMITYLVNKAYMKSRSSSEGKSNDNW